MMKTGLVLSGGGARGICHLGVLKALDEFGIQVDCISGTSAGGIVACMYSYGYSPNDILRIIQETSLLKSLKIAWRRTGLLSFDGLREALARYMPENTFDALRIPVTLALTEMQKGRVEYISQGDLMTALQATCSVPAVFAPVRFRGGIYVDGGLVDNLPVKGIYDQCQFVIGSHCNFISSRYDITNIRSVVERSLLIAINGNTMASKRLCHVLVEPPDAGKYSGFDVGKAAEIFEIGYAYTRQNFKADQFHP